MTGTVRQTIGARPVPASKWWRVVRLRTYREAQEALDEAYAESGIQRQLAAASRNGWSEAWLADLPRNEASRQRRFNDWSALTKLLTEDAVANGESSVNAATATGRLTLLALARRQVDRVADLRIDEEVRALLYDEFYFVARPTRRYEYILRPGTQQFSAQSRLLTFNRLPAGQLHFEVSGFPRSWLSRVPARGLLSTAKYLAKMRGFAPIYETHVAHRWTLPVMLLPEEDTKSYQRIARTIALNPHIRGVMSSSWLNDPDLSEIDPHLAWRFEKLRYGAHLTTVGPSDDLADAAAGNAKRADLIEKGEWRPRTGVILWNRAEMLKWNISHAH